MELANNIHLSYCTNIHPAETWEETFAALRDHALTVRDQLSKETGESPAFALGMRLSAVAATELLAGDQLEQFQSWLVRENAYVYTINGFPFGAFHGTRVKEKVYQPDWTTAERLNYTLNLFKIIAELAPIQAGGSVSTLPGSFKEFQADEDLIFQNLYACAEHIAVLAKQHAKDLHLGLEPEPLGHFENTEESLAFFQRFNSWAEQHGKDQTLIQQHIGINYDTCHFALEYDDCFTALNAFAEAKIRISKIHLSNALSIDLSNDDALASIRSFDEPTYLHQVLTKAPNGKIQRHRDIPEFFAYLDRQAANFELLGEARVHFHIPLYADPDAPLGSTRDHAEAALAYISQHPQTCPHLEMETYTWGVLPAAMQLPIHQQLTQEYLWTLKTLESKNA
ncbi:metabolite traffic protein EboE [Rubritalea marina]|uniref:metabolite traffic protein EboE n=1 Tax=Rubritalea marina TaxID=361055 RepID=UPI00036B463B|nr:metabolite traffic protein EboE [Rubritalea marina]